MPLFGGGKKHKKKLSRKEMLNDAFSIQLNPTARDRAAAIKDAAKEAAVTKLERDKKHRQEREEAVEKAEAIKAAALERRGKAAAEQKQKDLATQQRRDAAAEQRSACTCRKTTLDNQGKCTRCHKKPASRSRRRR